MTTPFTIRVTAAQVGRYFLNQYYHVLQEQPSLVHQFYNNASTMLRIDGSTRETATTMLMGSMVRHSALMDLTREKVKNSHTGMGRKETKVQKVKKKNRTWYHSCNVEQRGWRL